MALEKGVGGTERHSSVGQPQRNKQTKIPVACPGGAGSHSHHPLCEINRSHF